MMGRYVVMNFPTNRKYEIKNGGKVKEPFQKFLVTLRLNNSLIFQLTKENWVHYLF